VHKQTDKQTDSHYENNGQLAVNQKVKNIQYLTQFILQFSIKAQLHDGKKQATYRPAKSNCMSSAVRSTVQLVVGYITSFRM